MQPDLSSHQLLLFGAAAATIITIASGYFFLFTNLKPKVKFLDGTRQSITLRKKTQLTHNTYKFTFSHKQNTILGLPVGHHIKFFAPNVKGSIAGQWNSKNDITVGHEEIARKYTPISGDDMTGYVEFVIKLYTPCDEFPDGGKMSTFLDKCKVGDSVQITGPIGRIKYKGFGHFESIDGTHRFAKQLGMIAGGSGIAPMYQIIQAILYNPFDRTHITLLFANRTADDVILKNELEDLQRRHQTRLRIIFTIDRTEDSAWPYEVGYVNSEMIQKYLPPPSSDALVLICGPPAMVASVRMQCVGTLNYNANSFVSM